MNALGSYAAHRAALGLISVLHRCHQACHMPKRTCLDPRLSFKSPSAVQAIQAQSYFGRPPRRPRACSHACWSPALRAHLRFQACIPCPLPAPSRDYTSHDSGTWESEPYFFCHPYHQRRKFMLNTFWGVCVGGCLLFFFFHVHC